MSRWTPAEVVELEKQHGELVHISHADGSEFLFRRIDRELYDLREARAARGEDADDMMLQERCIPELRDEWNAYAADAAFATIQYSNLYQEAHGGGSARAALPVEMKQLNLQAGALHLTVDGKQFFQFRKPARAEVKLFAAMTQARGRGEKQKMHPVESILRQCSDAEFGTWLDRNLFGIGAFGDAFVRNYGMGGGSVTGK